MKKYRVNVFGTFSLDTVIEANDKDEAADIAYELVERGVADIDDYYYVDDIEEVSE